MAESGKPNVTQPLPQIGSYRLIQQLGSGGMSSVFKAIHVESGHEVAVKVLPRSLAKNPTLLQRFLREARSAEALEHANIVAIFDRGVEDGRHYLVLEYVPGGDLHDRVREKGSLSAAETIAIMRASAEGLSHAAGRGLIHRDIKPANLLLDADGKVKITDLGLALQMDDEDERVTRDGTTVGTVDYMAPEQARDSRATSVRSDIYSLGGTAYFLLTGTPPFPGGDVPDKLRRHAQTPAPDVRMIRPDVPEPLARLIQKMMAKRPEARFASYDELIAALDAIPLNPAGDQPSPLYALIDDDDDDEDDFVLTEASIPLADDRPTLVPSRAIDPPRSGTSPTLTPTPSPRKQAVAAEVNMAELAALDEEDGPRPAAKRRPAPAPAAPPPGAFDLDDEEVAYGVAGPPRVSTADDVALKTYIMRGLAYGLAIALLGIGLVQLVKFATSAPKDSIASLDEEQLADNSLTDPAPPLVFPRRIVPVAPKPSGVPEPSRTAATESKTETPTTTPAGWVEPTETTPLAAKEAAYSNIDQARFFPDWAAQPVPDRIDGPFQTVRRVSEDRQVVPDLIRSFNVGGGTVELADNGPFFERDLRITGQARLIRARPGFRPIVVLQAPTLDYFRNRRSILEIEGKRVIFDGLDLVLRTDDHRGQTALFLCKGADLTLRNCTITVVGTRPFNLIQVGEPFTTNPGPPSKIRLEGTFVRGAGLTAVALFGGDPADVAIDRSVLLCGGSSAISVSGRSSGPRRLWCKRSILAARGPILDVSGRSGDGSPPLAFRALGSTLARINGPTPTSLIVMSDDSSGPPRESLDWLGFDNTLVGWDGWLSEGSGRAVTVANLASARATWSGTDETSREQHNPWPASSALEEATPASLQSMAPDLPTLSLVAAPSPYLWSKSLGTFRRQELAPPPPLPGTVPEVGPPGSATLGTGGTISPQPRPQPNVRRKRTQAEQAALLAPKPATPSAGIAAPSVSTPEPPQSPVGDLTFDASAPPWNGNLGAFLKEQYRDAMLLVRVRVRGSGVHPTTPVRLPDGVALEVVVEPDAGRTLVWTPQPGAPGDALFEARNADLTLSGVHLTRADRAGPNHLVQVEDGRLTLINCQLTAGMEPERAGPGLVALRSQGTRPLPSGNRDPGRPVCRLSRCVLITGGTAVEADLGHGVIALDDCAIASGTDAIVLHPQTVRRDRFEADLWLDHCTLVAGRSFVLLGPWNGSAPGPDRPWLVSSYRCAFLDAFDRGAGRLRQAVVLRADAEALAQGALLWQPSSDVYDVSHFTAAGDATPVVPALGADVERQWVAFWGPSHVASPVTGPGRGGSGPGVRLLNRKLRPSAVKPSDLALDPKDSAGRKAPAVGARLKL